MTNKDKIIKRWLTTYYSKAFALKKLKDIENSWWILLWIDGLFIWHNYTQPSMEHSVDYSNTSYDINIFNTSQEEIYKLARDFIKKNNEKNMYFELVFRTN